jgi:hypothetical protein
MFVRTNDSLDGNACQLVAGEIGALAHCREFQPKPAGGAEDENETSDLEVPDGFMQAVQRARDLDRRGYLKGLNTITLSPNVDHWNAHYDADKDEVGVQHKLTEKPGDEQVRTLLHEAGHRGHYRVDPDIYERFKKFGLVNIDAFLDMANQAHLDDYAATGKVDGLGYEIFAESYARAMLGLDMPEALRAFWAEAERLEKTPEPEPAPTEEEITKARAAVTLRATAVAQKIRLQEALAGAQRRGPDPGQAGRQQMAFEVQTLEDELAGVDYEIADCDKIISQMGPALLALAQKSAE